MSLQCTQFLSDYVFFHLFFSENRWKMLPNFVFLGALKKIIKKKYIFSDRPTQIFRNSTCRQRNSFPFLAYSPNRIRADSSTHTNLFWTGWSLDFPVPHYMLLIVCGWMDRNGRKNYILFIRLTHH